MFFIIFFVNGEILYSWLCYYDVGQLPNDRIESVDMKGRKMVDY
jgi:hypothetical protein